MVFGLYTIDIDIIQLILVGFFFYLVQIWDSTLSPVCDLQLVRLLYLAVVFRTTRWAFFGAHCNLSYAAGEDRNEQSRMLTRGATRFSILEADPSAVVSFK